MINNLKCVRNSLGLTQSELAYICGVTRETIIRLEKGENIPNLQLYFKLEYALLCGYIYDLEDSETNDLDKRINHILEIKSMKAAQR